jgi:hypothetical protein
VPAELAAMAGAPLMASGGVSVREPILAVGVLSAGPNGPAPRRLTSEEQPARKAAVAPTAVSRRTLRKRAFTSRSTITLYPHSTQSTQTNKRQRELRERLRCIRSVKFLAKRRFASLTANLCRLFQRKSDRPAINGADRQATKSISSSLAWALICFIRRAPRAPGRAATSTPPSSSAA